MEDMRYIENIKLKIYLTLKQKTYEVKIEPMNKNRREHDVYKYEILSKNADALNIYFEVLI